MKILFVGGVDMAGRAIATRLFREGHQVCWLTREVERPLWTGKVEGKVYRQPITYTTCRQVMQGEAADCVVLLTAPSRESYLDSGHAHGVLLADLSPVLRAAASVKVGRVWLLSSEDLRDEGLLSPALEELRAAERVVTSFCQEKGMQWLILRFGCLFGEGDTEEIGFSSEVLRAMQKEKALSCPFAPDAAFDLLCGSDLADAAFRLFDMGASGVYSVLTGSPVTARQLYDTAAQAAGFAGAVNYGVRPHSYDPAQGLTLRMEWGWMPFYPFQEAGLDCLRRTLAASADAPAADAPAKARPRRRRLLYETGQNLFLFAVTCLLAAFTADWSDLRYVDVRLLYVVIVAISFGMRQGLLATGLAIASYTADLLGAGIDISYIFYSVESWIPFILYGVAGAFAGYWSDKKNDEYDGLMQQYTEQGERYSFLKDLYREVVEIKNSLQKQIVVSKDSFSRIYSITRELDSLNPRIVLLRTIRVMEEILECDTVALYAKTRRGDGYMRLLACSAKLSRTLSSSADLSTLPRLQEAIAQRSLFVNRELDERYPAFAMPIYDKDMPVVLAVLYQVPPEKFTSYYQNLFQTLVQMLQNNLARAFAHEEENHGRYYLPGTRILTAAAFREELDVLRAAEEEYNALFSLARLELTGASAAPAVFAAAAPAPAAAPQEAPAQTPAKARPARPKPSGSLDDVYQMILSALETPAKPKPQPKPQPAPQPKPQPKPQPQPAAAGADGQAVPYPEALYARVLPLLRGTDILGQGEDGALLAIFLYVDKGRRPYLEKRFGNNGVTIHWEEAGAWS